MPHHFLPETTYADLVRDLAAAFTIAAYDATTDLPDQLRIALANFGIMPASCRADFTVLEVAKAA